MQGRSVVDLNDRRTWPKQFGTIVEEALPGYDEKTCDKHRTLIGCRDKEREQASRRAEQHEVAIISDQHVAE